MLQPRLHGLLLSAVCSLSSCDASDEAGALVDGFKAGFGDARARTQEPADRSLTVAEYEALGIPATDHRWSADELGTAVSLLARLAEKHPEQLPRYESARSGPVFHRLVEFDAPAHRKEPSGNSTEAFATALAPFGAYTEHYTMLSNAYAKAYGAKQVGCREFVEVQGIVLSIAATMEPLIVGTIDSLPEGDPRLVTMDRGRVQMREGYFSLLEGSLVMLAEPHPKAAKRRLVEFLRASAPPLFRALSESDQRKLRLQLRSVPAYYRSPGLEAAFE